MIPRILPGTLTLLLGLFAIAIIFMAILAIFKTSLYNRLSTRIIALIFATGLVAVAVTYVFSDILYSTTHPQRWQLAQMVLIAIGGPVLLGLLAARFVQRPLKQFNNAVASLEQSNYKVQLQPTGIDEFDEVFMKFNGLINRLEHEEKLRKDLVSDASHELNTPLSIMIGQLTAMQEGKHHVTKERITILKEQAERLDELVQQLNAYTKARMADTAEPEDIHVAKLCKQLTTHFSSELKERSMTTALDIADNLVIHANRDALQRIITNLIQNALRYSEATQILITANAHELTFSDNGKGVPKESLPYLFERFYRVDKSRNRATGGLGLGLAIVKELAESQGWAITTKDNQPGLAFTLKLDRH